MLSVGIAHGGMFARCVCMCTLVCTGGVDALLVHAWGVVLCLFMEIVARQHAVSVARAHDQCVCVCVCARPASRGDLERNSTYIFSTECHLSMSGGSPTHIQTHTHNTARGAGRARLPCATAALTRPTRASARHRRPGLGVHRAQSTASISSRSWSTSSGRRPCAT